MCDDVRPPRAPNAHALSRVLCVMPPVTRRLGPFALALSVACAGAAPAPVADTGATFVLVSWNVNYGLRGDPEVVALLDELPGDVVLLQECTPDLERALRASPALRARYPHARFHDREGPGGLAVLSRFPIASDELLPEVTWFPAWRGVVVTPLGPVQFLNVHLRPPFDDHGSMVSGVFVTPSMRVREIEAFTTALDDGTPTIIAGDFNEVDGDAIRVVRQRGMTDALDLTRGTSATWRWTNVPFRLRLDHVFADDDALAVATADVVERGNSDHFPVVVTVGRRAPARVPRS